MLSLGLGIRPLVLVCTEASFLPKGLIRRETVHVAASTSSFREPLTRMGHDSQNSVDSRSAVAYLRGNHAWKIST